MLDREEVRMSGRVISREEAIRAGRSMFAARAGIDMEALALDIGVSRATLYRVASSRDRLLGDVLWSFAGPLYARARAEAEQRGIERLLEVLRRFGSSIMGIRQFREFLAAEPQVAIRVLFTPAGDVHRRFVETNKTLILDTAAAGEITLPFDIDTLAYVFSRIFESMWYADLLSGRDVDLDVAERAARAVLLFE
jgi:AcrR family transcriptional regulator